MKKPFYYGGQAVIEGVMMMGPKEYAVSVRKADGTIITKKADHQSIKTKYPILKWPIVRGFVNLVEMMALGMKNITWSANQAGEEDEELGFWGLFLSIAIALVVVVGVFIAAPVFAGTWLHPYIGDFGRSLIEGVIRIALFILYVVLIRRMEDIRRVFQYHGAEHKSIAALENGDVLTSEAASKYTTLHMRCGTAFMLMVMIVMIIVFTFVGQTQGSLGRIVIKLLLLPVIAGLTYEVTHFAAGHCQYRLVRWLMAPGLWMQKLTTEEPSLDQIEVALTSLKAVMPDYYENHPEETPPLFEEDYLKLQEEKEALSEE